MNLSDQSSTAAVRPHRRPWNKGRLIGAKPPLKPKQVWTVRFHLRREQRWRDLALFDLAIDSKLLGCDVVQLRVCDVSACGQVYNRALIVQQKTDRPVQFEVTESTRDSVSTWLQQRCGSPNDYLFPSRRYRDRPITTRHYARLLKSWLQAVGLNPAA